MEGQEKGDIDHIKFPIKSKAKTINPLRKSNRSNTINGAGLLSLQNNRSRVTRPRKMTVMNPVPKGLRGIPRINIEHSYKSFERIGPTDNVKKIAKEF